MPACRRWVRAAGTSGQTDRQTHPPARARSGLGLRTLHRAGCVRRRGRRARGSCAVFGFSRCPFPCPRTPRRAGERSPAGAGDKRRGWRCRFDPVYLCPWVCAAPVGWCRGALARGSAAAAVPLLSGAPRRRGSSVRGVALEREHPPQCWGFPALLVPWLCPRPPARLRCCGCSRSYTRSLLQQSSRVTGEHWGALLPGKAAVGICTERCSEWVAWAEPLVSSAKCWLPLVRLSRICVPSDPGARPRQLSMSKRTRTSEMLPWHGAELGGRDLNC